MGRLGGKIKAGERKKCREKSRFWVCAMALGRGEAGSATGRVNGCAGGDEGMEEAGNRRSLRRIPNPLVTNASHLLTDAFNVLDDFFSFAQKKKSKRNIQFCREEGARL